MIHYDQRTARCPRPILIAAVTASALLATAIQAVDTVDEAEGRSALEVILATPQGVRQEFYSVEVTFSEPMVRLGDRGKPAESGPIRFEPPLQGSFTWLGTRTVSFIPNPPPPPGSRIVCTLPRGTRAVSGRQLSEEFSWAIIYRPASLIASIPRFRAEGSYSTRRQTGDRHPPDDPILLAFDRPVSKNAPEGIELVSESGPVALRRAAVLSEHVKALRLQVRHVDSLNVLALRPDTPLELGGIYRLIVTPSLRFKDSPEGLTDRLEISLHVLESPQVLGVEATSEGFSVSFTTSVDPDTLLALLHLNPQPENLSARLAGGPGDTSVLVKGDFAPRAEVEVQIPAGVRDLHGRTTTRPFSATFTTLPLRPRLDASPSSGRMTPVGPDEFVRLTGRNTEAVQIRWTWVTSEEMPLFAAANQNTTLREASQRLFRTGREPLTTVRKTMPWESRWVSEPDWLDPQEIPDSLCLWERRLVDFRPLPRNAQLLLFEATTARTLQHALNVADRDTIFTSSYLQPVRMGISSRRGGDGGLVWVTELSTGLPVADAAVSLWSLPEDEDDTDLAPVWTGRTDEDGICWTPGIRESAGQSQVRMIRAEAEGDAVWLLLNRHGERKVDTSDPGKPNSAFLITDRPLYRPGETIHWKAVVRRCDRHGLTPIDLGGMEAVLSGPRSAELRLPVHMTGMGNLHGEIELPEKIPTGGYTLNLLMPQPDTDHPESREEREARTLHGTWVGIEEFRAPRFEARVSTTTPLVVSGTDAHITGRFDYFSGPPLAGQPVRWRAASTPIRWSPPGWAGFEFHDFLLVWSHTTDSGLAPSHGEQQLDENGRLDIRLPLSLPPESADSEVTIEVGARDLADQSAHAAVTIKLVRGPYRPGIRLATPSSNEDPDSVWEWIVVDTQGTPVEGIPVVLEFGRSETRRDAVVQTGGAIRYETSSRDSLLSVTEAISTGESQTLIQRIPGTGVYFLRTRALQPDGSTCSAAVRQFFTDTEHRSGMRSPAAEWLNIAPDLDTAGPGDTIHLSISAPPTGAEGLILLESGGIAHARRVSLPKDASIPIPLDGVAPPDATITVLMVSPDQDTMDERLSRFPWATVAEIAQRSTLIQISRDRWRASVDVRLDRETLGPREEVEIEIRLRSPSGNPLSGEVALAVVDEAVLVLAEDQISDPLDALFRARRQGIAYDETRGSPMVYQTFGDHGTLSARYAGSSGGVEAPIREDFRPTAYWNPAIPVGPDGIARVRVRLPDTLTRYRIRATAVCEGEHHGVGQARVRVTQPIVVEPAVPRFVRLDDEWTLGAIVENRTEDELTIDVSCRLEGAELSGDDHWRGSIGPGMRTRVEFRVHATQEGEIGYLLETISGDSLEGDRHRGSLVCVDPVETIPEITFGRADPVAVEVLALDDETLAEARALDVRIAPSLLSSLSWPIDYLIKSPHPSLEQRVSRLLALLARRNLADRLPSEGPEPAHLDSLMMSDLAAVSLHMKHDGFAFWPGSYLGSPYLDGYVLYTLARLRSEGVEVPDELYTGAWDIVRTALDTPGRPFIRIDPDTRAFLVYSLIAARIGLAPLTDEVSGEIVYEDLERLETLRGQMSEVGRLCLALAMGEYARQHPHSPGASSERLQSLFDDIAGSLDRSARLASLSALESPWPWSSYRDDRVRATALAALFLSENIPSHPLLPSMINWLLDNRERGRWGNTHESALALEALRSYGAAVERLSFPLEGRIIPGLSAGRAFSFAQDDLTPYDMRFTLEELSAMTRPDPGSDELPLRIEAGGQNAVYYQMTLERQYRTLEAAPQEEGLIVFREYVDGMDGKPVDVLVRGEPYYVHLVLVVPWDAEVLFLEDPLPAGVEAVNLNLSTTSRLQERVPRHVVSTPGRGTSFRDMKTGRMSHTRELQPLLPVVHKDLRDDRVALYADRVYAGIYHIYYPVTATMPGIYAVPGARAELIYVPVAFGTSGAARVEVR